MTRAWVAVAVYVLVMSASYLIQNRSSPTDLVQPPLSERKR